jgi:hypothetical protein
VADLSETFAAIQFSPCASFATLHEFEKKPGANADIGFERFGSHSTNPMRTI